MRRAWACCGGGAETGLGRADVRVTRDLAGRELAGAGRRLRDGGVAEIGTGLTPGDAQILDASGCVVTPGLVNTHHHLFQSLTRAVPGGQDALLFGWLRARTGGIGAGVALHAMSNLLSAFLADAYG